MAQCGHTALTGIRTSWVCVVIDASVNRIAQMQDGIQVRVVTHPWMDPEFWDRVDKLTTRKPGDPHPFVVPDVFRAWVGELKTTAAARFDEAQKAPPAGRP